MPCPEFGVRIVNLSRHLRGGSHNYSKNDAHNAFSKFALRKSLENHKIKLKTCTFPSCNARVVKLSQHLKKCHSKDKKQERLKHIWRKIKKRWEEWQLSPDAGGITEVTVQRNISQVESIQKELHHLENLLDEAEVSSFFTNRVKRPDGDATEELVPGEEKIKKLEASSARTYLFALTHFYTFLQTTNYKQFHENNLIFSLTPAQIR